MTRAPRVTIGLLVYNGERFLNIALDSLLKQTFTDFELIISDNASTDATEGICREYAARDARIRYFRADRNRGAAWNYNRTVELAHAEYFKWAAHDDRCAPQFLESCIEVLDREPSVVLCYPQTVLIDERDRHLDVCVDDCALASPRPSLRFRHLVATFRLSNPMFGVGRSNVIRLLRPLRPYPGADVPLMAELALRGPLYRVNNYLFFRRDHPQKSNRANSSPGALAAWYDPANAGKPVLDEWLLLFGLLAVIARTPMPPRERVACYAYMAKWFRWRLSRLERELILAAAATVRRSFGQRCRFST